MELNRNHASALFAATALAAFAAAPVSAHGDLETSTIADGAEIASAPAEMTLTFEEPMALAGVSLTIDGGDEIPLDFTPSRAESESHAIALPTLAQGGYVFTWRALGEDGHVVSETIAFTVTGEPADSEHAHADHDGEAHADDGHAHHDDH